MFISFFSHTYARMYICITPDGKFKFFITPDGNFSHTPEQSPDGTSQFLQSPDGIFVFYYYPTEHHKMPHYPTEQPPKSTKKIRPGGKTSTKIYGCLLQRAATFRRVCYRRRRAEALSAGFTIEEPSPLSYVQHRSC